VPDGKRTTARVIHVSERDDNLHSLISGATLVVLGGVVSSVSKLVERIIVGRTLPPDVYGEVNIAIVIMTFATTIALFGYTHATTRYVSRFEDERDVRGVWVTALLVPGLLSLLLSAVLVWRRDLVLEWLFDDPEAGFYLLLFLLTIPFRTMFRIAIHTLRGFEKAAYKAGVNDLLFPAVRIAILVTLFGLGYGAAAVGYAYVVSTALVLVVAHVLLHRLVPLVGRFSFHGREMTLFAAPLIISTMLSFLLVQTDTLLLGAFRTSYEVGLYAAAVPIATGMLIVLKSFGFMYLPIASRLDAEGNRDEIDDIYATTTKWVYVVSFPAFATFVCFPKDVIRAIFGPEYVSAWPALVVLSVGYFVSILAGLNRDTLSALGHTTYLLVAYLVAFGTNVGLDLWLIPRHGIVGAAVASASALVALNVVLLVLLFVRVDTTPFSAANVRTFAGLPVLLLPPVALLSRTVSLTALSLLPFLVAVGLASIFVVTVVGGLEPDDGVVLELVEDRTGLRIPFVRGFLPSEAATDGGPKGS